MRHSTRPAMLASVQGVDVGADGVGRRRCVVAVTTLDQLAEAVTDYGLISMDTSAAWFSLLATYVLRHGFIYLSLSKWALDWDREIFKAEQIEYGP